MTAGPVRAVCLPVAWRFAPRRALRLSLDAPPRCFESASTTDVSLTSTRRKNTLFGDCPPSAAGKTQRRSASRSSSETRRRRRRSSEDAGPPRGHPASNGSVLDGTSPASGRLAVARALSRSAGERSSFLGCLTLRRSNPLTPPAAIEAERVNALLPSLFPLPQAARQCCPLSRDRGAFRRGSPDRAPSRAPAWSSAPVGQRAQLLHVFIDVLKNFD